MDFADVKFSKLFLDKHGKKIFEEITSLIRKERVEECNSDYIESIFKVAFMGYFGLDDIALNRMLKDIKCNADINNIKKIHKYSIKNIQEYIKRTNSEDQDI